MNVVIFTAKTRETGWGHYVRMSVLALKLRRAGHRVTFMCNEHGLYGDYPVPHASPTHIKLGYHPDWLVYDMPGDTPAWVASDAWKVCVIDGVGQPETSTAFNISQGLEGKYCAPEYLILRPEVEILSDAIFEREDKILVFGGGNDDLGLLDAIKEVDIFSDREWYVGEDDFDETTRFVANAAKVRLAIVSMGMIVWELAALKIPTIVFSKTDRHLRSARLMYEHGYVSDYFPATGVPNTRTLRRYLDEACARCSHRTIAPVTTYGADNIVKLMETNNV